MQRTKQIQGILHCNPQGFTQGTVLEFPHFLFQHWFSTPFFTHAQSQALNFFPNKRGVFQGFCQNGKVSRILTNCSRNLKSKGKVSHHLESAGNDSNQAEEPLRTFNQAVVQINLILDFKCFEHEKHNLVVLSSASSAAVCLIPPNGAGQLLNFCCYPGL